MEKLKLKIEAIWTDRSLLEKKKSKKAIRKVIKLLDKGLLRVAADKRRLAGK